MPTPTRFPMLSAKGDQLRWIPWDLIAPHEAQARKNHDQSLETLANRGGLDYRETLAVLLDIPYLETWEIPLQLAERILRRFVNDAERG